MRDLPIEEIFLNKAYQYVDVRSPKEFNEAHIPGAVCLPLFSDEERAEIGILYANRGPEAAKWRAMEMVSPKIPHLMEGLRKIIRSGKEPALYCWRGGMRSKAVATFAGLVGLSGVRLIGGYRAYRQYILEHLNESLIPDHLIYLHGLTGVGKTKILLALQERGWPTVDLEAFANHRGSVFGNFGYGEAYNQKMFDSLLYERLCTLKGSPFLILEAESRRIGKATQPDFLLAAREKGVHLLLTADLETRVTRLYEEYVEPYLSHRDFKPRVEHALTLIAKRISPAAAQEMADALNREDYPAFIRLLLLYYYDPMYRHKQQEYESLYREFDVTDLEKGVGELESYLNSEIPEPLLHP
ncbi:tRNA 2-selenouridine synthase [[Clostridium] ultunense Esp]|nr:tRNA 2-selenouridine synthase [[Clostridium] ultunense Esp]